MTDHDPRNVPTVRIGKPELVVAAGSEEFNTGVMAGLVPAIHVFLDETSKTWMPGTFE